MNGNFDLVSFCFRVLRGGASCVNDCFVVFCHRNNWGAGGNGYEGNFGLRMARTVKDKV
jgi:hypothetical protein